MVCLFVFTINVRSSLSMTANTDIYAINFIINNQKLNTDGNKKKYQAERGLPEKHKQGKRFAGIGIGKGAGEEKTPENRQS